MFPNRPLAARVQPGRRRGSRATVGRVAGSAGRATLTCGADARSLYGRLGALLTRIGASGLAGTAWPGLERAAPGAAGAGPRLH